MCEKQKIQKKRREKLSKKKKHQQTNKQTKNPSPLPKNDTSQVDRKYIKIDVTYIIIRESTTHFKHIIEAIVAQLSRVAFTVQSLNK